LKKIITFLDQNFSKQVLPYLEFLVYNNHCTDIDINSMLFIKYLRSADTPGSKQNHVFTKFVFSNRYYDGQSVLKEIPKDGCHIADIEFLTETVHILSTIDRHKEALEILAFKIRDWNLAENYCLEHYSRNNDRSNNLFTILYELFEKTGNPSITEKLHYLKKFGFRMKFKDFLSGLDQELNLRTIDPYLLKSTLSLSDSAVMQKMINRLLLTQKENV
jgi:hypothetical protein